MGYLETDYYERVKKDYEDEIGLFGRVEAPSYMADGVKQLEGVKDKDRLESFLTNQIDSILDDDKLLNDIDSEIERITEGEKNQTSRTKNQKLIQ